MGTLAKVKRVSEQIKMNLMNACTTNANVFCFVPDNADF